MNGTIRHATRPSAAALALAALVATGAAAVGAHRLQDADVPTVRQEQTKVEFPVRLAPVPTDEPEAEPGPTQVLLGTALRDKTIFGVDVYAYGLYVEPRPARERLAAWEDVAAKERTRYERLYRALYAGEPIPKTLRIVFVRDVDGEDVADAFEGALAPRVRRAAEELELDDATSALARFRTFFELDRLRKGNEILISADAEGRLTTRVAGELAPAIGSPALAWALFDVYLGEDPIEERGKRELVGRLDELFELDLPPPEEGAR
jgi:hypothetical protein